MFVGLSFKLLEVVMLGLFNMVFGVSICDGEWLVVMGRLVGDCGCFL